MSQPYVCAAHHFKRAGNDREIEICTCEPPHATWQSRADLFDKITAVRGIHRPEMSSVDDEFYCAGCTTGDWMVVYPCPTIRALDGAA